MNRNEQAADALDAAHDYLLVNGWIQHSMYDSEGKSVCAVGGIYKATGNRPLFTRTVALSALHTYLALEAGEDPGRWPGIALWNDEDGRTIDDVLDSYRHAAKDLRNGLDVTPVWE